MKQYVCSICGYVYDEAVSGPWEALPADWKCPICKAGKEAFRVLEEAPQPQAQLEKPHVETELSPMEMSIICSNLARGCEKQYLFPQMEAFQKLADFRVMVKQAGTDYNPSILANYAYDLVKEYNQFYHDFSILREEDEARKVFRLVLSKNVSKVIKLSMGLLGIEVPERM